MSKTIDNELVIRPDTSSSDFDFIAVHKVDQLAGFIRADRNLCSNCI